MEKIVIFGSSNGGQTLYTNLLKYNKYELVCFIDNNESKYNTKVMKKDVLPPPSLKKLDYCKVYIGSQFVKEIKKQLLELGVLEENIIIPPKYLLGDNVLPFKDKRVKAEAEETMCIIAKYLSENNIRYSFSYGTLLGLHRDNGIIPWDTDIDISLFDIPKEEIILKLCDILENESKLFSQWRVYSMLKKGDKSISRGYKLINNLFHVDLSFTYARENLWFDYISKVPLKFFDALDEMTFNGVAISTPKDIEGYLKYLYGKNWKTPIKENSFDDNNYSIDSKDGIFENILIKKKTNLL